MDDLEIFEKNVVPSCDGSDPEKQSRYRGTYFAVILYPDNDGHMKFLQYVQTRPQYDICYIFHQGENVGDPDDGKVGQDHYHCLIHVRKSITVGSFVKFFEPWVSYAECIKDYISYLAYMLHDTPRSIDKMYHYSIDDLRGDPAIWRPLIQKSHFVQYNEFLKYYSPGMTVNEVIHAVRLDLGENAAENIFEFVRSNSFLVIGLTNQDNNALKERNRKDNGYY